MEEGKPHEKRDQNEQAKGGEILASNVVRELAKGKDFLFSDRGEVALKGFDEPVRLYEVRWQEEK